MTRHAVGTALLALLVCFAPPVRAGDDERPLVVVNFHAKGKFIETETYAPESLVALVEVALLENWGPVSEARLLEACRKTGVEMRELPYDAMARLDAAREIGATSVFGWAYSFGKRVELILEVIDPKAGLPGKVYRTHTNGVDGIPDVIDELLRMAGLLEKQLLTARVTEERVDPEGPRPEMRDLHLVYARIPEDDVLETYPNKAFARLVEMREEGRRWVPRDEYADAERLLSEAVEHADRLKSDPRYRDEFVVRMNMRVHPIFREYDFDVVSRPPYLIFVEKTKDGRARDPEATARALRELYDEFHRQFGKRLRLPDAASLERPYERILKVVSFGTAKSFDRYQKSIGMPLPPGVNAYYTANNQWLVVQGSSGDDVPYRLLHDGTHQIMHLYRKVLLERKRGEEVLFSDRALRPMRQWFSEGLAELFAGSAWTDAGRLKFAGPFDLRIREWRQTRTMKKSDWTLAELFRIASSGQLQMRARQKGLAQSEAARLASLFYAQSWAFCHYLWHAEDGKHREKLFAYMEKELKGEGGYEALAAVLDPDGFSPEDLAALEKAWRAHAESLEGK